MHHLRMRRHVSGSDIEAMPRSTVMKLHNTCITLQLKQLKTACCALLFVDETAQCPQTKLWCGLHLYKLHLDNHANNNYNIVICKAHKLISNTESEALAVARWAALVGYAKRTVLRRCLKVSAVGESLLSRGKSFQTVGAR